MTWAVVAGATAAGKVSGPVNAWCPGTGLNPRAPDLCHWRDAGPWCLVQRPAASSWPAVPMRVSLWAALSPLPSLPSCFSHQRDVDNGLHGFPGLLTFLHWEAGREDRRPTLVALGRCLGMGRTQVPPSPGTPPGACPEKGCLCISLVLLGALRDGALALLTGSARWTGTKRTCLLGGCRGRNPSSWK